MADKKINSANKIYDFLALLKNVKPNGPGKWTALCPAHGDTENSLSVGVSAADGRILVNCFAGCSARDVAGAVGWKLSDLFVDSGERGWDDGDRKKGNCVSGPAITVADLARDKCLPLDFLKFYTEQLPFGVKIIYKSMNGRPAARQRLRTALAAKEGSKWFRGAGSPLVYGVWRVGRMAEEEAKAKAAKKENVKGEESVKGENGDYLLLVEGESDAWTAWLHKIPALGIPGADMAGKLAKSYVEPFSRILIWREPDAGGKTFVDGLSRRLAELGYTGEVYVIQDVADDEKNGAQVKDLNDLHKSVYARFPGDFDQIKTVFREKWAKVVSDALSGSAIDLSEIEIANRGEREFQAQTFFDPSLAFHNLTDMGNADRLNSLFGDEILYCYPWNTWLVWSGKHWQRDESGEIDRRAEATVRSIYAEAAKEEDRDRRFELAKHAKQSENASKVRAMIDRTKNRRPVMPDQLDQDLYLLNVKNGTIDLRTGEIKKHDRRNLITKISPAEYRAEHAELIACGKSKGGFDSEKAELAAPLWHKFLREVTGDDPELMAFLQRAAGYALTGDTSEHCLFFLHGDGRNGKSVFLNVLEHVLGDYGSVARPDVLMAKRYGDGIPNEIAALVGVRYVSTTETGAGKRFAEAMLKQYTGGDTISARFLHAEFFTFAPQFKIFLASNNKPIIRGQDVAIWERIYLIPFTVFIPPETRDKQLTRKLKAEADGILAWAVAGCLEWQEMGLAPPAAVQAATEEYRQEMDVLSGFMEDCCYLNPTARVNNTALWRAYKKWCEENGERYTLNRGDLKAELERRGVTQKRTNVRYYLGVGLLAEGYEAQGVIEAENDDFNEKNDGLEEVKKGGNHGKDVNRGQNSLFSNEDLY